MNKGIIIRASIVMGIFLVILGAAYGCSLVKSDGKQATVSNGDSVYLTLDDMTITKAELWDVMKGVDGLDYLIDYVDAKILADYIAGITQDEIDKEVLYLTYLTESEDVIAEIQADPEIDQEYLDSFDQNLIILGYDPTNADDIRAFVELSIAKTKMAKEMVAAAVDGETNYISEEKYKDSYDKNTRGDVCALEVRFSNAAEVKAIFNNFNLVLNFDTGIGGYTGTVPIEDVANDEFTTENTVKLTAEQAFSKYVMLYNYMNPWADQLPTDITMEDYCANYADIAVYNYEEMTKDRSTGDPNIALAKYLFDTLDETATDAVRFSYSTQAFSTSLSMAFKVSAEEVTPYEDLSSEDLAAFKDDYLDTYVTDAIITSILETKREEAGLEIFDHYLKLKYEFNNGITFDGKGSETIVAKLGTTEITADELYSYMEARLGAFYSIELVKAKVLLASDTYTELYGNDYDYLTNDSDEMIAHREELRTMKTYFSSNSYASYGFPSSAYTWEEFLYLAFSAKTESDVIEQLFILGNLQPDFVYPTISYNSFADYVQTQIEEYFSLNVNHLLLYVDFNKDFEPDSFDELRAAFTVDELAEYTALKVAYQNLVYAKIEEGKTFAQIVTEFKTGLIDDPENEWAEFKAYGFLIMNENLSASDSLTAANTTSYDDAFVVSLKRIYDLYTRPENKDADDYLDTQLTISDFGVHLILATPGSGFDQPSAEFELTTENSADYTAGYDNVSNVPSLAQINLYLEIKFAAAKEVQTDVILPDSVYKAVDAYVSTIYTAYFTQTGISIAVANYMLDNNASFGPAATQQVSNLEDIIAVLYAVNFPEGFVVPTE
ncbi:MAG: hypothetical protein KJ847_03960 [Firmicutes bacterium]|nr:hypothetical protein [Bacillota bacterium]